MNRDGRAAIPLVPNLPPNHAGHFLIAKTAKRLNAVRERCEVAAVRAEALGEAEGYALVGQTLRVCLSVMSDLRIQGWQFRVSRATVEGNPPRPDPASALLEKQRIREAHLFERDTQLSLSSTREFIRRMETPRLGPRGWASVHSLLRDGAELEAKLRQLRESANLQEKPELLRDCIDPYIQFVEADSVCDFTGLKLMDIWRYFRHTWVIPYYTVPGRQMCILVRDRAAANHPVIGIAALGSSVVQLTSRDSWIGWTPKEFVRKLQERPTSTWADWLENSLRMLIRAVYVKDFIEEGLVQREDLRAPSPAITRRLRIEAEKARHWHIAYPKSKQHKSLKKDWQAMARTFLFKAKRATALASLLDAKRGLRQAGFSKPTREALAVALGTATGRRAVETVLKQVKAAHVGIDMLDITVCGAIAPYNALLGGKLVAMMLTSPEIGLAYQKKYANSESVIASSMAGRAVIRKPRLVLLSTTSLYGVSSSQYNRIRIPAEEVGGKQGARITYESLGKSLGYGSYHISAATAAEMDVLLARSRNGRRVNSIFGEGVNPRLRKIRDGFTEAGFSPEVLLVHGNSRLIYGVPLASNFRKILLGLAHKPNYLLPRSDPASVSNAIAAYWIRRWLSKRIQREEALNEVRMHCLSRPLRHGALVPLPAPEEDGPTIPGTGRL